MIDLHAAVPQVVPTTIQQATQHNPGQQMQLFRRHARNPIQAGCRARAQVLFTNRGVVHPSLAVTMERLDILTGRLGGHISESEVE